MVQDSPLSVKQTLLELDISRSTFYRWYECYLEAGYYGLKVCSPQLREFWNRIQKQVVEVALAHPKESPRELAYHITNMEDYFISESSVYRILKAFDFITSPAFILLKAYASFRIP